MGVPARIATPSTKRGIGLFPIAAATGTGLLAFWLLGRRRDELIDEEFEEEFRGY